MPDAQLDYIDLYPKATKKRKKGESVVVTVRADKELVEQYDQLVERSGHSRNELICMAMQEMLKRLRVHPADWDQEE